MTVSGDFIPMEGGNQSGPAPSYPTAFGITFTPAVSGVIFGLVGLLGAGYLATQLVLPTWQSYQDLQAANAEKQTKLDQQLALQKQQAKAEENLAQAKQQQASVRRLFSNETSLDTLLLDLNRIVQGRRGVLTKFEPVQAQASNTTPIPGLDEDIVTDGSLGPELNGKLKRKIYTVSLEGNYDQILATLRNIERLQSLVLVKDFKSELDTSSGKYTIGPQNQVVSVGKPVTTIKSSLQLQVLMPLTEEEAQAYSTATSTPPTP